MGANATTFVPSYTSGEVLTAANLSVTNSGIPVFATTVTRDAAFGGTGEKTLAEGQFAYIEATNTTQYYDGAAWLALGGKIAQIVDATTQTAVATSSTAFVTTGLTATITPSSTSSKVLVIAAITLETSASPTGGTFLTLFRGTVAGTNLALGTNMTAMFNGAGQLDCTSTLIKLDSPSTSSAQVYTVGMKTTAGMTVTAQAASTTSNIILIEVLA
jgi:hypothetical protein